MLFTQQVMCYLRRSAVSFYFKTNILPVFVLIILSLFLVCTTAPRYTRNITTLPKSEEYLPSKPEKKPLSKHKNSINQPIPKVEPEKEPVSKHKKTITQPKAEPEKEIPIKLAFAPEMRIPSGPIQINEEINTEFKYYQKGKASYYANKFHGRKTANGEQYDKNELTAAHPRLPFNSIVKITNLKNNRSVVVRINDRGPFAKGRIIDLSNAAANKINLLSSGVADVVIEIQKKESF